MNPQETAALLLIGAALLALVFWVGKDFGKEGKK
jgi:hypothetical protein